jgi:anti-anti-sigma regulatory factor
MFRFPPQLTIVQVAACKTALLDEINNNEIIELDDSAVERIDTLGIQLIFAAVLYIYAQNKQLNWQSTSKIIQQNIKQLGLNETILNQHVAV